MSREKWAKATYGGIDAHSPRSGRAGSGQTDAVIGSCYCMLCDGDSDSDGDRDGDSDGDRDGDGDSDSDCGSDRCK